MDHPFVRWSGGTFRTVQVCPAPAMGGQVPTGAAGTSVAAGLPARDAAGGPAGRRARRAWSGGGRE
ncbi:hypothetical protein DEF24_22595, partial [Marinitenerispora sediminis]